MFIEKFESVGCYYILYSVGITIYTTAVPPAVSNMAVRLLS